MGAAAVAAEPAERPLAAGPRDRLDRPPDVLLFLLAALEEPGLAPAPAVGAGLVPRPLDRPADGRVALDRHGAGEERHLQLVLVEEAQ